MNLQFLSLRKLLKTSFLVCLVGGIVLTGVQAQRVFKYLAVLDVGERLGLLVLGLVGLLEVLLPAATFLAVLYVYRSAWRSGQITTIFACGYSPLSVSYGSIKLAGIVMFLTAIVAHHYGPIALNSLKQEFEVAFESGRVYPVDSFDLGDRGGVEILGTKGLVRGFFEEEGVLTLVHAKSSQFLDDGGRQQKLQFNDVTLANRFLSLETHRLTIALPTQSFHRYPKVLRGSKLIPSAQLKANQTEHQYAFLRRCVLILMIPLLFSLAVVLPKFLGDVALACSGVSILAFIHLGLRGIEILAFRDGAAIVAMALLLGAPLVMSVMLWRRTFWQI